MSVDPQAVRNRMLELEKIGEGVQRSLGEAAAEIVGVEADESFEKLLLNEVWRTQVLCRTHYTPRVSVLPDEKTMAAALVQGMTLAEAIRIEQANQERMRLLESEHIDSVFEDPVDELVYRGGTLRAAVLMLQQLAGENVSEMLAANVKYALDHYEQAAQAVRGRS